MKHYALIGEKLGHSLSRPIHEAIFRILGIDADYRLIEIPKDGFDEEVRRLLSQLDGFNVTIPYKERIMPLLRRIDAEAAGIGAVNTVVTDGAAGHNTDAAGFMAMLRHAGIDPSKTACSYILGSGGTSKTARYALTQMGAETVRVVSRSPNAEHPWEMDYDAFYAAFPHTGGVIVNTSPAGMWPNTDTCAIRPERLADVMNRAFAVADVVYNPRETLLTKAAARAGIPWCTGLYMLIAQAVEAEAIWQGRPMPGDLTDRLMKELNL